MTPAGSTARPSLAEMAMVPPYPVATLPNGSKTVTSTPTNEPATAVTGSSEAMQADAAAGTTFTDATPRTVVLAVSSATSRRSPAVLSVTCTVLTPASAATKVRSAGSTAAASVLVRCTVPRNGAPD